MVCVSAVWPAVLSAFARAMWTGAMVLCCDVCAAVLSVELGFWVCGSGGRSSRARYYLQVRRAKRGSHGLDFQGKGQDHLVSNVVLALVH